MATLLFSSTFTTRIHDIDAAGVMFYARYFYHSHDAYEDLLKSHNFTIKKILQENILLPISHTEAQFKSPIRLNESISINIYLAGLKKHSFSLEYHFIDASDKLIAQLLTRHVCLSQNNQEHQELPYLLQQILTIEK